MKTRKVAIIGAGGIASCLRARLEASGVNVPLSIRRNQSNPTLEELLSKEQPDAVCLAISTLDKGESARDFILTAVGHNVPIVTCEKGAWAYHSKTLEPHVGKIGFSAAVGGGTRMLNYVKGRLLARQQVEINAVVNGTLNFVFDEMRRGRSLGEACAEARRLGYAEPGATDALSLVNGELTDVRLKTCVFFNTVLAGDEPLTPDQLGLLVQTSHDLSRLSDRGADYRAVVSFSNRPPSTEQIFFGNSFNVFQSGWYISGGFRLIGNSSELTSWLPSGVGNAIHIVEGELGSGGKYTLSGPGAGHEPTTSAMITDLEELLR